MDMLNTILNIIDEVEMAEVVKIHDADEEYLKIRITADVSAFELTHEIESVTGLEERYRTDTSSGTVIEFSRF